MNILDKFEIKLKQNIETIRFQNKQINESEVRFKQEVDERQRVHQLYETQLQNCRHLTDLLSKLETDSKIASEKQSIEFKEEKNLSLNQIQRMSEQINQLKHELNAIQSKSWSLERTLHSKQSEIQKLNTFRLTIDSELNQIQSKCQSLAEELRSISQTQTQLKDFVESFRRLNVELRAQLNQSNQRLSDVNKDNSTLKTLVTELKTKCDQTERVMNDNELQSLRLTQQNDLQKQEINELRALLEESIREKQFLTQQFNKTRVNKNESTECDLNIEDPTQV